MFTAMVRDYPLITHYDLASLLRQVRQVHRDEADVVVWQENRVTCIIRRFGNIIWIGVEDPVARVG